MKRNPVGCLCGPLSGIVTVTSVGNNGMTETGVLTAGIASTGCPSRNVLPEHLEAVVF